MDDKGLSELLRNFDLTNVEINILNKLCYLGPSQIGILIKKTGIHRGTVYNSLQRLTNKGFVSIVKNEKNINYAISPYAFLSKIHQEKNKFLEMKKKVKEIITYLKSIKKIGINDENESCDYYEIYDKSSFKNFFIDLLVSSKKSEEKYKFIGDGGEMRDVMGAEYYNYSQNLKKNMMVKCQVILNKVKKDHPFAQEVVGTLRWIQKENRFPVNTWIYGNKVAIIDWSKEPIHIIILNNKNIAKNYEQYFKILWNNKAFKTSEMYNY